MLTYNYTAKDQISGQNIKAEVQAESESAAAKLLIKQNLIPIAITPKGEGAAWLSVLTDHVSTKERILFTRQLSTLINAGLPLTQSLRSVRDQIESKKLLEIINQVVADVEGGSTLADSFRKYPKVFNDIYVSLVAAGEASGSLDKALARIADQQEKDAAVTSKIRSALIYPVIVLFVIGGVLIFMLTTVLPQIEQLYLDLGEDLPFLTAILVGVAHFIQDFWYIVLAISVGLGYGLYRYFKSEAGREFGDRLKLSIPLFGKLFQKLYMSRFCRTSGVLLMSGLPMLEVLRITENAVNNYHIEQGISRARNKVKGGKALSAALTKEPDFTTLVPQMIKIGEDSGTIDDMLERTANYYEDELDTAVKNLSTTIEPILMVVLGVTVGGIVAAILLPVYGLIGNPNLGA